MPIYAVERVLPGATLEAVEHIERTADQTARAFTEAGRSVRYMGSIFIPGESRCQSLFEAPTADLLQELNTAAGLPYGRIVLAVEVPGALRGVDAANSRLITDGDGSRKEQ